MLYTHNLNNDLRTLMNERTHFFIKMCISHTLFSKGLMFLWCVRDGWRHWLTAILTNFFSWSLQAVLSSRTHLALLPHLGWGCLTGCRWGPQPSVCKIALTLAFLSPMAKRPPTSANIISLRSLAYASSFTYLHRCISDWRLGQGSIYNTCRITVEVLLSP